MKGKFIVIEGTDCSGKETQTKLIEKKLKEQGYIMQLIENTILIKYLITIVKAIILY